MDLRPADDEGDCAKLTIWTVTSRLQWTFAAETFEVQTGESSVKSRFCHQAETSPQVRQARGLHRSHYGGYQATLRSSEAERISEGGPEKSIILRFTLWGMPRRVTR